MEVGVTVTLRWAEERDRAQWDKLFEAYCAFGGAQQTPEMRDRVWAWIHDPSAQTRCFVVADPHGQLVGFVHFRAFERPMDAAIGGYIDDMFVASEARGQGVVDLMIENVGAYAKKQGWDVVRWMTSDTNYRARAVYDRHAVKSDWITYQLRG